MIEKMFFPVPLTDRELLTTANYSGMLSKTIAEKEAEFAEIKAKHRESLRELKEALVLQMDLLANKKETREVDVEILFNTPEKGKKTFRDPVTEEVWDIADMTEDDNEDLFVNAELNPTGEVAEEILSDEEIREADTLRCRKGEPANPIKSLADVWLHGPDGEVCADCNECHYVLHVDNEVPICGICRDKRNNKKMPKIDTLKKYWEGKVSTPPKFRVEFGYGCSHLKSDTSCFRFMLESGSWGNHIYMAGDFKFEGSQAFSFYNNLLKNGWAEA